MTLRELDQQQRARAALNRAERAREVGLLLRLIADRGRSYARDLARLLPRTAEPFDRVAQRTRSRLELLEQRGVLVSELDAAGTHPRRYYRLASNGGAHV